MKKVPPGMAFVALTTISLIVWMRPLLATFSLAIDDDKYTHILLILPLAAALIVQRWKAEGVAVRTWTPAAGLLVLGLAMAALARWGHVGGGDDGSATLAVAGLVVWWIGSFAFCFGGQAVLSFAYPLFFLFWMVPLPKAVVDWIVAELQHGSVLAAQGIFLLFRVPVSREGITLTIPGLDLDVTSECSSIRSSLMLLVTTMVLAYLLLKAPWRRALVIALAVPLSIAKNGLRIFTIGMLGTRVDESYLTGRFHHHGGIVFFLVALALIFVLLWALRRGEISATSVVSRQTA
jgi:exosortase